MHGFSFSYSDLFDQEDSNIDTDLSKFLDKTFINLIKTFH